MKKEITAVIFDWAGTTIDQGSCGPIHAFIEIFAAKGIVISGEQVRGPMGMHKLAHIKKLAEIPEVNDQWIKKHGNPPQAKDFDELFSMFEPALEKSLLLHSKLIPKVAETIDNLKTRNIKIGSTTGYSKSQMNIIVPEAKKQGFVPDAIVCSSDVSEGRPAPWMIFEAARQMNVYPPSSWVKVDDTLVGIQEGKNAGAWTIGVTKTGNLVGLGENDLKNISSEELNKRISNAEKEFRSNGADFVVESVAEIIPVINEIEQKIKSGIMPRI